MPVPSSINDIYTVAGSNPPSGGETPAEGDNHLRAAYSFIAALRDILNGTSSSTAAVQSLAVSGAAAFGGAVTFNGNVTNNANTVIGSNSSDTLTVNAVATFVEAVDFDSTPTGKLTSNTYTPTLTNGNDIASSSAFVCQYGRLGDFVIVSGRVTLTTSSDIADQFELGMSLPIASNFSAANQLGGTGADSTTQTTVRTVDISADTTNDRASFKGRVTVGATPFTYSFLFAYQVI